MKRVRYLAGSSDDRARPDRALAEARFGSKNAVIASLPASARPIRSYARVVTNVDEGNGRKLRLAIPDWPGSLPGQFVMIGAGAEASIPRRDPLLPRPMAVYREHGGSSDGAEREAVGVSVDGDPAIDRLVE